MLYCVEVRTKLEIEVTRKKLGQYDRVETWNGFTPIQVIPDDTRQAILIGSLDDGILVYASELVEALNELGVVG